MQAAIRLYLTAKRRLLVRDENMQVNSAIFFLGGGKGGLVHGAFNCDYVVHGPFMVARKLR